MKMREEYETRSIWAAIRTEWSFVDEICERSLLEVIKIREYWTIFWWCHERKSKNVYENRSKGKKILLRFILLVIRVRDQSTRIIGQSKKQKMQRERENAFSNYIFLKRIKSINTIVFSSSNSLHIRIYNKRFYLIRCSVKLSSLWQFTITRRNG